MTDDPPTDESSLSHLSSQLIAAGFLSRPLELVSLFASSSSSSSSTATSEASYHRREERLKKETKAREQIVKCLWNMLASRLDEREGLEKAVTGLQVKEYELERMRASVDRAEKDKAIARKESEGDKARAKAAMKELEEEKEKYRRCREELAKAKSALGFVRTQAAHDLKRREVELSTTQTRFQRLTSESTHAQTRLVVLTPASPIAAPSFASRSGRRTSPTLPSPISSSASPAEVVFLEEALAHCEEERVRFAVENEELRNVVGEVVEWCDGAMELPGVGKVEREGAYVSESTWEGDESMSIPAPHASRPINAISPHLRSKLSHVRSRLETALDTTEDEVAKAREEVMDVLREEREERGREAGERRKLEGELAKATKVIEDGEELVKAFSTERFLAGIGTSSSEGVSSFDDTPVRSTVLPASTKLVAQAQSQVQAEDSRVAALIELSKSRAVAEAEKKKREAEEKRQKDVASFLDDLGLDSPAPVLEKEAMRSKDVRVEKKKEKEKSRTSTSVHKSSSSTTSTSSSSSTTAPKPSSSFSRPSSSSSSTSHSHRPSTRPAPQLSPLAEADSENVPSPYLRLPSDHDPVPSSSSTALAGILALADSPQLGTSTTTNVLGASRGTAGLKKSYVSSQVAKEKTKEAGLLEKKVERNSLAVSVSRTSGAGGHKSGREKENAAVRSGTGRY